MVAAGANPHGEDCYIDFFTAKDVVAGEQLCICYGSRPEWDGPEFDAPSSDDGGFIFNMGSGLDSES